VSSNGDQFDETVVFGVVARDVDMMRSSVIEKVRLMTAKLEARR
jgi:hypothetical protein